MQEAEFQIKTILANVKSERSCKQCGVNVGKGKQICPKCRESNKKAREIGKVGFNHLPVVLNFRRDEDVNPIEKRCTICDKWLALSSFNKRKDTASGCKAFCKDCERSRTTAIRASNPKPIPVLRSFKCEVCNNDFQSLRKSKYCSKDCAGSTKRENNRRKFNSIHVAINAACKRCGEIKSLDEFEWDRQPSQFKIRPWVCSSCKEARFKNNIKRGNAKRRMNPKYKVRKAVSKRFHEIMSTVRNGGTLRLSDLMGCSTSFLRSHLESQFKRGMKWENYGTKWQVDHILPCSSFDHSDINQVKKCWHYSNLRPLCAIENNLKSDKIITCQPELLLIH